MARPAHFSRAKMIEAAADQAAKGGPAAVTIASMARQLEAPTGSVYHRFHSRDELMAGVWLDATASFQRGFLEALRSPTSPPGLAAALFAVEWARSDPVPARLVVLYRRQDFAPGPLSGQVRQEWERLAAELDAALGAFAATVFAEAGLAGKQRAAFLLLDLPQAAVRRYLAAGISPPAAVDDLVRHTFRSLSPGSRRAD